LWSFPTAGNNHNWGFADLEGAAASHKLYEAKDRWISHASENEGLEEIPTSRAGV